MARVGRALKGLVDGFLEDEANPFASIPVSSRRGGIAPSAAPARSRGVMWAYSDNEGALGNADPERLLTYRWYVNMSTGRDFAAWVGLHWGVALEAPVGLLANNGDGDRINIPFGYPVDITHTDMALEQYDPVDEEWAEVDHVLLTKYASYPTYLHPLRAPGGIGNPTPANLRNLGFDQLIPLSEQLIPPGVNIKFCPYAITKSTGWAIGVCSNTLAAAYPTNTGLRFILYPYRQGLEPEGE